MTLENSHGGHSRLGGHRTHGEQHEHSVQLEQDGNYEYSTDFL
jgi:hypothetical protein